MSTFVYCFQWNQTGRFLKVLAYKFSYKSSPNISWGFLHFLENIILSNTAVATFWQLSKRCLGYILCQHLVTLSLCIGQTILRRKGSGRGGRCSRLCKGCGSDRSGSVAVRRSCQESTFMFWVHFGRRERRCSRWPGSAGPAQLLLRLLLHMVAVQMKLKNGTTFFGNLDVANVVLYMTVVMELFR